MALSIRNPDVELMARELSRQTGETMTDAISGALSDRLALLGGDSLRLRAELLDISAQCAASPDFDTRPIDEILGYAESGAF